jgi:hypothetical protein
MTNKAQVKTLAEITERLPMTSQGMPESADGGGSRRGWMKVLHGYAQPGVYGP